MYKNITRCQDLNKPAKEGVAHRPGEYLVWWVVEGASGLPEPLGLPRLDTSRGPKGSRHLAGGCAAPILAGMEPPVDPLPS